ncbi:uncharacterized protein PRCAT00004184001 [Priceomyces carsonii]|uniref:uncharacterized protein n=1 Tax=Priceomyces carsonii TaxID=28549 RepID=UPI002EDB63D1|nr:unnamed protein product [Priceomyces carsonii]
MSSSKDYKLEVVPPIDSKLLQSANVVNFIVRNKSPPRLVQYRIYILACLVGLICYQTTRVKLWGIRDQAVQIIFITGALMALVSLRQEPQDTMIVMRDIGIQLESKKAWRFQTKVEHFVPLKSMIDLVIHEGFHGYGQVIFYLCVLKRPKDSATQDNSLIKIIFPEFLPRKEVLIDVWRLSRELLFGSNRRYWRRIPGQGLKQIN